MYSSTWIGKPTNHNLKLLADRDVRRVTVGGPVQIVNTSSDGVMESVEKSTVKINFDV